MPRAKDLAAGLLVVQLLRQDVVSHLGPRLPPEQREVQVAGYREGCRA